MALDAYQREARKKYLGSSDASAVVGLDPYRTAYDVWAEKTGRIERNGAPSDAAATGTYFEGGVLDWAEAQIGQPLVRDVFITDHSGIQCANLDALFVACGLATIVEAKTVGLHGGGHTEEWGDEGTDQVPDRVLIQATHQLMVSQRDFPPARVVLVPAFIAFRGFVMFRIERNDALVESLREREERFWWQHVKADVPPPDSLPSFEVVRSLKRVPNKSVSVEPDLVNRWLAMKDAEKEAGVIRKDIERALLAALGDAESGVCELGEVTYMEVERKGYEVQPTTYRALRFKQSRLPVGMR